MKCSMQLGTVITLTLSFVLSAAAAQAAPITGNLELWLKADAGVEEAIGDPAESGDSVRRWLDQSGNGRIVEQTTGSKQPVYSTTGVNGQPAISFNGENQWLSTGAIASLGSSDLTIFAMVTGADDSTETNQEQGIFTDKSWNGLVLERTTYGSGSLSLYTNYSSSGDHFSAAGLPTTGFPAKLVGARKVLSTSAALYQDGAEIASVTSGTVLNTYTGGTIYVGNNLTAGEDYTGYHGYIAEEMVFSRALNDSERIIVENYFASKYGTTTANDHYAGDTQGYTSDVFGIGRQTGSAASSSGESAGLSLTATSSLDEGDWLLAGHKVAANSIVSVNGEGVLLGDRWDRVWSLDQTGTVDAQLVFDSVDAGLGSLNGADQYSLIYSPTNAFNWSVLVSSGLVSGDTVTFSLTAAQLADGFFTLGINIASIPEPSTFVLLLVGMAALLSRRKRNGGRVA